ncbi:MAG: hypothetical protein IJY91_07110 [Oscillospiraceae bacterium]|nr:hypothetical protein [Oscillospiraceae bacterium]
MVESRKIVLRETAIIAVGEAACCGIMVGVFALVGHFDLTVLWGALIGFFLTVANFFVMAVGTSLAADKAQEQNVSAGKNLLRGSMGLRYVVLFVLLFAFARSGICNVLALVLPLAFVRPVLMLSDFFRKKEG